MAPPWDRTSSAQAAQLVAGLRSYPLLEQVNEVEHLAIDRTLPRAYVGRPTELAGIDADAKVNGRYQRVRTVQAAAELDADDTARDQRMAALAERARSRATSTNIERVEPSRRHAA